MIDQTWQPFRFGHEHAAEAEQYARGARHFLGMAQASSTKQQAIAAASDSEYSAIKASEWATHARGVAARARQLAQRSFDIRVHVGAFAVSRAARRATREAAAAREAWLAAARIIEEWEAHHV